MPETRGEPTTPLSTEEEAELRAELTKADADDRLGWWGARYLRLLATLDRDRAAVPGLRAAAEDSGRFGHNLAVTGIGKLGHSGEWDDCPQPLCVRTRAALAASEDRAAVQAPTAGEPRTEAGRKLAAAIKSNVLSLWAFDEEGQAYIDEAVAQVEAEAARAAVQEAFCPLAVPGDGTEAYPATRCGLYRGHDTGHVWVEQAAFDRALAEAHRG